MKLKNSLANILTKNSTINLAVNTNRIISTSILLGMLLILSFIGYKQSIERENEKQEYKALVAVCNEQVDNYNLLVDKVNKVGKYLLDCKLVDCYESAEKKLYMQEMFEEYYRQGANKAEISDKTESYIRDIEMLYDAYSRMCVEAYNSVISEYNAGVEKHNSLLARIEAYNIENLPEPINKLKSLNIKENSMSWENGSTFIDEVNSVMEYRDSIQDSYYELCVVSYKSIINDFNIVADAYNCLLKNTAIDFVEGLHKEANPKELPDTEIIRRFTAEELCQVLDSVIAETEGLVCDYLVVEQITNPSQEWIIKRLEMIDGINEVEAVTNANDPNGLLGKDGGYKACIYFVYEDIDINKIQGITIVEKGTDAGGAIEVYKNVDEALNRCDYLSQFDGTILYSGSYAIIGTMVIRTSYILSNKQQIDLTSRIVNEMTLIR